MFREEQIQYMKSLGISIDFYSGKELSDDEWDLIDTVVSNDLLSRGFDDDYEPNKIGLLGESIMDVLGEVEDNTAEREYNKRNEIANKVLESWDRYNFNNLEGWERRFEIWTYMTASENNSSDCLSLIYDITESRMLAYAGRIAIIRDRNNPKLIFNTKGKTYVDTTKPLYSSNGQYVFIQIYTSEHVGTLVIDVMNLKYAVIRYPSFDFCTITPTGDNSVKLKNRDGNFKCRIDEEIRLSALCWHVVDGTCVDIELAFSEMNAIQCGRQLLTQTLSKLSEKNAESKGNTIKVQRNNEMSGRLFERAGTLKSNTTIMSDTFRNFNMRVLNYSFKKNNGNDRDMQLIVELSSTNGNRLKSPVFLKANLYDSAGNIYMSEQYYIDDTIWGGYDTVTLYFWDDGQAMVKAKSARIYMTKA